MSKINITKDKLKELLDNESWLTAQECYDMGFADELLPMSDDIEQSASKSIMDLVKENQNLKMQLEKVETKENTISIQDDIVEQIANKVVERLKENETITIIQKEVNEDLKHNMFESFFNGILKNER